MGFGERCLMGFCTEMIWITPGTNAFCCSNHFLLIVHVFLRDFQKIDINKIILSSQFSCLKINMKPTFGGKKHKKRRKKKGANKNFRVLVNLSL